MIMQSDKQLKGKVAIVTGASRGVGRAIAAALAGEGAEGVVCSRNLDSNTKAAEQINAEGGSAYPFQVDVTYADSVSALEKSVVEKLGRVDILVNNAGYTADNLPLRLNEADWDIVIDTNRKAPITSTNAVARTMIKK